MSNIVFKGIGNPGVVQEHFAPFRKELNQAGFRLFDDGSFRSAFIRKNCVIKVPLNRDGIIDNIIEFKAWKKYGNGPTNRGLYLAPCRLLSNNCLMMVRVNWMNCEWPDWASGVDSEQIGVYRGRVVAYDYALNLTERLTWEKELKIRNSFFQRVWKDNNEEYDVLE